MSALAILGAASFLFVAGFTARALRNNTGVGQTPRVAIIEAWTNIAIGFSVNFCANFLLFPLVGVNVSAADNFMLGWCYTAISVVRSYLVRRFFNFVEWSQR